MESVSYDPDARIALRRIAAKSRAEDERIGDELEDRQRLALQLRMVHDALMPCATHFCKGFHVFAVAREPRIGRNV
jgi:hypothetical protein